MMTEERPQEPKRSAWPLAVVLLVVVLVYVMSYAPVVRLKGGWRVYSTVNLMGDPATVKAPIYGDDLPIYRPVDWLIDNTPFQDPLLEWAEFCGVGSPFRMAMMWRPRGTGP